MQGGLNIIPNVNLINNVGLGADSTNFNTSEEYSFINLPTEEMKFPLKHPPFTVRNSEADKFIQNTVYRATRLDIFKQNLKKILQEKKLITR